MKEISLNQCSPIVAMTTAAVKVLLTFMTSIKANCCLAATAFVTVAMLAIDENQLITAAVGTTLWILHFAAMSAIDIRRKGGKL